MTAKKKNVKKPVSGKPVKKVAATAAGKAVKKSAPAKKKQPGAKKVVAAAARKAMKKAAPAQKKQFAAKKTSVKKPAKKVVAAAARKAVKKAAPAKKKQLAAKKTSVKKPAKKVIAAAARKAVKKAAPAKKKQSAAKQPNTAKKPTMKKPTPKTAVKKNLKPAKSNKAPSKPVKKAVIKPAKKAPAKPAKKVIGKSPVKKVQPKAPAKPVAAKTPAKPAKQGKTSQLAAKPKAPIQFKSMPLPTYHKDEETTVPVVTKTAKPAELTSAEIVEINKTLTSMRDEVVRRVAEKKTFDMPEAEVGDPIDVATQNLDKELLFEITDNDHIVIDQIEAALRRIKLGSYGICESCRCTIPKKRLHAMPFARYCVNCQHNNETSQLPPDKNTAF